MSAATRHGLALALSFLAGVSLTTVHTVWAEKETTAESNRLPLDELRTFTGVLDAVKQDYVEPVKDKDLLENAIRGMLSNLDPHSAYLDAEAFQDFADRHVRRIWRPGHRSRAGDSGFIKIIAPRSTIRPPNGLAFAPAT